jgi:hypothetical protein
LNKCINTIANGIAHQAYILCKCSPKNDRESIISDIFGDIWFSECGWHHMFRWEKFRDRRENERSINQIQQILFAENEEHFERKCE